MTTPAELSESFRPVLMKLTVESFRGFNDRIEFDLDATAVIIFGPNGLGKTSFFDAIQWLILGDIERLRKARLSTAEDFVINKYAGASDANVRLDLRVDGALASAVRTGNARHSELQWIENQETFRGLAAKERMQAVFGSADADLAATISASGMLQQDLARLVLEAAPRERFQIFSEMLGLGRLKDFESWTQREEKETSTAEKRAQELAGSKRLEHAGLTTRLATIEESKVRRSSVNQVVANLERQVSNSSELAVQFDRSRSDAVALVGSATVLATESSVIGSRLSELLNTPVESELSVSDQNLEEAASISESLSEELESASELQRASAEAFHSHVRSQETFARLVSEVVPFLSGAESCPICDQPVDGDAVASRLLEHSPGADRAQALSSAAERSAAIVEDISDRLVAARRIEEETRQKLHRQRQRDVELAQLRTQLTTLGTSTPVRLAFEPGVDSETVDRLRAASTEARLLATAAQELVAVWDSETSEEEAQVRSRLGELSTELVNFDERAAQSAATAAAAHALRVAARKARLEVVENQIRSLTPLAQNIFQRLDAHPTFTELSLVPRDFGGGNTATAEVADEAQGVAANPLLVFSTAQSNLAALSYLVALNWASSSRSRMLALDDPLQAMDDVNVLGFADLCRHVRTERQLLISTHEKRFANLLERKLASTDGPARTVAHEFVGWDRNGPAVKYWRI